MTVCGTSSCMHLLPLPEDSLVELSDMLLISEFAIPFLLPGISVFLCSFFLPLFFCGLQAVDLTASVQNSMKVSQRCYPVD